MNNDDTILVLVPTTDIPRGKPTWSKQYCMVCGQEVWMSDEAYRYWEQRDFKPTIQCAPCAVCSAPELSGAESVPGTGVDKKTLKDMVKWMSKRYGKKES